MMFVILRSKFNVFFFFHIRHSYSWRFHFPAHSSESQYDIQNNNFRKRLENAQKFTFNVVAFLFFLKYTYEKIALGAMCNRHIYFMHESTVLNDHHGCI